MAYPHTTPRAPGADVRRFVLAAVAFALLPLALTACFRLFPTEGGGLTEFEGPRAVDPADVALLPGYRIEPVVTGLTFPTGVAFDAAGRPHVTEAGYSYGDYRGTPRLLRVEADGATTEVARGADPPWTGVTFSEGTDGGAFFVTGGHFEGGKLLRVSPGGDITVLVDGLPSLGDHHTNAPVVLDGWVYFGQGTATNSAVVGLDNFKLGWPTRVPDFRDVPCADVLLLGQNFRTDDPRTPDEDDEVLTGPYKPFGQPAERGEVVEGRTKCGGAVLRVRPDGSGLEVVAWGFRNPFGLAAAPDGSLFVSENQYDVRGSRPVFGTGDLLWRVEPARADGAPAPWYGWPDFWAGVPLAEGFEAPGEREPEFVLLEHPGEPPRPVALLGVHASANGLDVSRSAAFGFEGDVFIAEFGDNVPAVGKALAPVGYKVVRIDPETGTVHDFAANRGGTNGPASWLGTRGLERPIAARFSPDGEALWVVDFGVMTMRGGTYGPRPGTGVLWKITRTDR